MAILSDPERHLREVSINWIKVGVKVVISLDTCEYIDFETTIFSPFVNILLWSNQTTEEQTAIRFRPAVFICVQCTPVFNTSDQLFLMTYNVLQCTVLKDENKGGNHINAIN